MSRYYLRKLSIEGFRGINNHGKPLVLEFNPYKVTSIFGENGTGKSSVFEALEDAIFGEVRRLSSLQRSENPDEYYVNKFHPGPSVVTLEFEADDTGSVVRIMVERPKNGKPKITSEDTDDPSGFLKNIRAETLLMDYRTFEHFIMETPLERGRFFSRLLGLEKVSAVRASLKSLSETRNVQSDLDVNALKAKLHGAQVNRRKAMADALNQLNDIKPHTFTEETFDLQKVTSWCLASLNEDPVIGPLVAGKTLSEIDYGACLERLQKSDRSGDRQKLAELRLKKGRLETPVDLPGLRARTDALLLAIRKRQSLVEKSKGLAFRELYQAAQKVLEGDWQQDNCPLCERPWEHASGRGLSDFLAHELENYREIMEIEKSIKSSWAAITGDESISKLVAELGPQVPEAAPTAKVELPDEQRVATMNVAFELLEDQRRRSLEDILREIQNIEATLPPSLVASIQAVTAAKNLTDSLKTYMRACEDEKAVEEDLAVIRQWHTFIDKAATDFAQAETDLVRSTVAELEEDIRTLYSAIMPNAPVIPKLSRQEGSEHLYLLLEQFYGLKDAHAVPLLSESFRNALGMAVFLAASRKRTYGGRFLVLDDVTSSFDSGNQTTLLEAIYTHLATPENPDGLQVIVLSHDGALKRYFALASSSGKAWMNHTLQGTGPAGLVAAKAIPVDQLRNEIMEPLSTTGDLAAARRAVRPYLEASLLQIIDQTHIRVPLDLATLDHKKMLKEMLEAIKWEIGVRDKAKDLVLSAAAVKEITQSIIPFLQANTWAHYATDSTTSVNDTAIMAVVDNIDRLVDAFKYTCRCDASKPVRKFYRTLSGEKQKNCGASCN